MRYCHDFASSSLFRLAFHISIFLTYHLTNLNQSLQQCHLGGVNIIYDLYSIREFRLATMTIMPSDWLKFQISENFYQLEIQDGHHHMRKFELMERFFLKSFCETTEPFEWRLCWNGLLQKSKRVVIAEHSFNL